MVIYHDAADGWVPNVAHHNFYNAYRCNVGTEDTILLTTSSVINAIRLMQCKTFNPQEGVGGPDCLRQ
jgi:hypothetical protein